MRNLVREYHNYYTYYIYVNRNVCVLSFEPIFSIFDYHKEGLCGPNEKWYNWRDFEKLCCDAVDKIYPRSWNREKYNIEYHLLPKLPQNY